LSRNRRLRILIDENNVGGKLLHFSPSRALFRVLSKMKRIDYISSDHANEFIAHRKYDITNIPEPQSIFDYVICYHILEHIIDDKKAISELYRVLKKNGLAFIQTPFKEGDIYEDFSIIDEKERETCFGQKDHVRVYSVEGLVERLEEVGFLVTVKTFNNISDDNQKRYGLNKDEIVLIARKS
jgi:SAM-dependent methyltransferase